IAMSTGTDVAMHAAGITLMRGDPALVADALAISHRTVRKIRENLFWAFFYNVIGIPLAAAGLLNPMVAGAAMAFSSVSVVGNALTVRHVANLEQRIAELAAMRDTLRQLAEACSGEARPDCPILADMAQAGLGEIGGGVANDGAVSAYHRHPHEGDGKA